MIFVVWNWQVRKKERGRVSERERACHRREMIRPCHKLNKWTFSWLINLVWSFSFRFAVVVQYTYHYLLFTFRLFLYFQNCFKRKKERKWFVVNCHSFVFSNSILLTNTLFLFWKKRNMPNIRICQMVPS